KLALDIEDAWPESLPDGRLHRAAAREVVDRLVGFLAEIVVALGAPGHADHACLVREQAVAGQVIKRGEQLAMRQVACRAEDDDDAGFRGELLAQALAQGIGDGWSLHGSP